MTAKRLTALIVATAACGTMACAQGKVDGILHEVVVTGTGTQHLLKDAPVQTEVISRKMLDTYGGKSLEEILGGLTASFAFSEGDMGSQMQLGGLGNAYILILIDGKRVHGDVGGENDLGLIDPHNIERIEIVKGAQSALYGSDAMAGVINIITKKHHDDALYLENTTRYGSYNDVRQHNGVGFGLGRLTSMTNFQLQHTDGWQNTRMERAEGQTLTDSRNKTLNKYTNYQLAERLDYQLAKDLSLYAEGSYYTKQINRPQNGSHPSCDVYTYDLRYRNASAAVGGKWNVNKRDAVTLDVDWNKHAYYYDYTARTYEYMKLEGEEYGELNGEWYSVPMYRGQSKLQSDQQRLMAQAKGVFYLPHDNTLSGGMEFRYDYLNAPLRTANGSASDWTAAAYVQDEFNMLQWLNVTGGLRLVQNHNFGLRLTPKISAMASLGDFRIRAGWGQGFKTPTVKELHYRYLHVMGSSTFFNIGNINLDPQGSNHYNAGVEYRGRKFTASVTGYINKLTDMIALVNVPVGEIPAGVTTAYLGDGSGNVQARMYKNMEDAKTYGVDMNASYKLTSELTLNASYSYLDTDAHLYDTQHNRLEKVTIDGMAHHKWSASAVYQHRFTPKYRLGLNLSTRGSSERFYQNNGNGKGFQIWRLNTTHDLGRTDRKLLYRLELGVDNLLNYRDRTMRPYHLGTTTAGTTVFATFSIKFKQGKALASAEKKGRDKASSGEDSEE
ncbi:MAG: TonB-dependent receptor [Bacteroidales bacterium]|nr:TonB-dependent receptor [Bacteroidales bacterium]